MGKLSVSLTIAGHDRNLKPHRVHIGSRGQAQYQAQYIECDTCGRRVAKSFRAARAARQHLINDHGVTVASLSEERPRFAVASTIFSVLFMVLILCVVFLIGPPS